MPSLLSSDPHAPPSFVGLLNLALLLLCFTNVNEVIANVSKYGSLISISVFEVERVEEWPGVMNASLVWGLSWLVYATERAACSGAIGGTLYKVLSRSLLFLIMGAPIALMFGPLHQNIASGIVTLLVATTLWCKCVSLSHVLSAHRTAAAKHGKAPPSVSVWQFAEFLVLPTLCFQFSYPRTSSIRWPWLARRTALLIFVVAIEVGIAQQYVTPCIANTYTMSSSPLDNVSYVRKILRIAGRLCKCAVPNLYVWLLGFFGWFHLSLNIIAELTYFGDRLFYKDFWNSTTLAEFWAKWNMPVHNFMVRHVYGPLRAYRYSRGTAVAVCFFLSAVFHEIIVSVPFRTIKGYAFSAMMVQAVLIQLLDPYSKGKTWGNVNFWISITLGQPLAVLLYYREYMLRFDVE
jgi:diacylglycerol O-acyltransferase-1